MDIFTVCLQQHSETTWQMTHWMLLPFKILCSFWWKSLTKRALLPTNLRRQSVTAVAGTASFRETFQFSRLSWKSTVHSCTTSCSQLPRLPACLGCLLLNIDRHLECHSSTIKLQRASEVVPALSSVCHTHTCRQTQMHLGRGVWHRCKSEALAPKSGPWNLERLAALSKAQCFGKKLYCD